MSLLIIAALLYLGLALGFILVVDNLVGLIFRDPRAPVQPRSFDIGRAFAASQKLYRK
ncbi:MULTISPECIES: hypothetical protein [unclassified Rhizobium]|uniref:hypothetical protein n=1 Tax=unclassified Rhizobium TaxID=2613769 RepID=UPI001A98E08B|nr:MULTISPECIES: hypothetical protein [unclassified Rhizobium]MBX5164278.1 hypothetical protein [Rhizobium sp. NZLR4b]MBX5169829.1 hypothetical protein [Rhizobium sp. NZLR1b]MBX5192808.1 hypothetical protein [Rhizobium sp. NZLR3b]MBX5195956.1 hypothetical protein [Rhizobium sp. NZLR10]MBX5201829.1 hypothetical protein [Rhizobium sp. NZLR1]